MDRKSVTDSLRINPGFDIIVIGGGATGLGSALDASLRGYRTLLLEKNDFSSGTSSRSTKLVHGGVRYLAQGDVFLVLEALRERGYLKRNAPHLVHDQKFIIPGYRWWEKAFYTIGLSLYDLMAGRLGLGRSLPHSKKWVGEKLATIKKDGLRGGVVYHDGQFDDSRLALDLMHSLADEGGLALNYFEVRGIIKDDKGKIKGVRAFDRVERTEWELGTRALINATGVWVDDIIRMDHPEADRLVRPSQGVHLVLDSSFFPGVHALMIPKTDDGRVLFAVPWHGYVVVGTTDTALDHAAEEPRALETEINFILDTAGRYLVHKPGREDVRSVFAGLRPLAAPKKDGASTKEISRSHKLISAESGLLTITGGKWTTYRKMAEDAVDRVAAMAGLPMAPSTTRRFSIQGSVPGEAADPDFALYGCHAKEIRSMSDNDPALKEKIHPELPYTMAEVDWILRNEMVIKLEDLLARRLRALFLNTAAARSCAPMLAERAGAVLGWNREKIQQELDDFMVLSKGYMLD